MTEKQTDIENLEDGWEEIKLTENENKGIFNEDDKENKEGVNKKEGHKTGSMEKVDQYRAVKSEDSEAVMAEPCNIPGTHQVEVEDCKHVGKHEGAEDRSGELIGSKEETASLSESHPKLEDFVHVMRNLTEKKNLYVSDELESDSAHGEGSSKACDEPAKTTWFFEKFPRRRVELSNINRGNDTSNNKKVLSGENSDHEVESSNIGENAGKSLGAIPKRYLISQKTIDKTTGLIESERTDEAEGAEDGVKSPEAIPEHPRELQEAIDVDYSSYEAARHILRGLNEDVDELRNMYNDIYFTQGTIIQRGIKKGVLYSSKGKQELKKMKNLHESLLQDYLAREKEDLELNVNDVSSKAGLYRSEFSFSVIETLMKLQQIECYLTYLENNVDGTSFNLAKRNERFRRKMDKLPYVHKPFLSSGEVQLMCRLLPPMFVDNQLIRLDVDRLDYVRKYIDFKLNCPFVDLDELPTASMTDIVEDLNRRYDHLKVIYDKLLENVINQSCLLNQLKDEARALTGAKDRYFSCLEEMSAAYLDIKHEKNKMKSPYHTLERTIAIYCTTRPVLDGIIAQMMKTSSSLTQTMGCFESIQEVMMTATSIGITEEGCLSRWGDHPAFQSLQMRGGYRKIQECLAKMYEEICRRFEVIRRFQEMLLRTCHGELKSFGGPRSAIQALKLEMYI